MVGSLDYCSDLDFALPHGIPGQRYKREDALDILRKRLARGEIDQKEYGEKKALLRKNKVARISC
jgi:hypothetical protein